MKKAREPRTTSALLSALRHPSEKVRALFIVEVAEVYGREQSIARTAEHFGCGPRTLERAMVDYPALAAAIEAVRNRMRIQG